MDKPSWWSKVNDVSWDKVKGKLTEDWQKLSTDAQKLGKDAAETAISFGHGARETYGKVAQKADVWSDELEKKLKADWEATHKDGAVAWEKVRDAVKHGWERTASLLDKKD